MQTLMFQSPEPKSSIHYGQPACEFKVLRLREVAESKPLCDTPQAAAAFWRAAVPSAQWFDPDRECLVVFTLDTRRRITGFYLASIGTLDTILCRIGELFKPAILLAAASIIIAHNHPSGDPTPSEADIKITRDLIRAGQLLKIEVADHLVIGEKSADRERDFCSLRELGYFYS